MNTLDHVIEKAIHDATGKPFAIAGSTGLGGGCIHDASCLKGLDGRRFFVKRNHLDHLPSFEAESHSLATIAATGTIRVPNPVTTCQHDGQCALVLEYLPMAGSGGDWQAMGQRLADMHRHTNKQHGWDHDNWIGSFPQENRWHDDWVAFYRECRLQPQIMAARGNGLRLNQADELLRQLGDFFADYQPVPSLLHGDLWAGNAGFLEDGTPVIFDPASYYGDRETDLAMTEMFGGYPGAFYAAYNETWPLNPGYRVRKQLYILYHTLNHYNIFGGGYGTQAEAIIRSLV